MRLLDLYCGAGGCSEGYRQAGFEVVGVDLFPQPKYPFAFVQADAIEYVAQHGYEFDAIHASPPCQEYSQSTKAAKAKGAKYVDLVGPTREALRASGKPYVIENVPGSPLLNPVLLCGVMFGLQIYRHRLFEANFPVEQPSHPEHIMPQVKMGRVPKHDEFVQAVGHFSGVPIARKAMGIPWMGQKELAQAIPPAYTRYVGRFLEQHIDSLRRQAA